jgi:ATP synthase protein I
MKKQPDRSAWYIAARAMSLGWDLALPVFAGVLLGYGLDRRLETRPFFALGLMMLGVFVGFYNMLRSVRRVEEHHRRYTLRENTDLEAGRDG